MPYGRLQADLPFRILGLESDNGTEFINPVLLDDCTSQGITVTRSRPYLENDTCHIERKNWGVVRRLVGYDRLETQPSQRSSGSTTWFATTSTFLHPVRKLVSKTGTGPRGPVGTMPHKHDLIACSTAACSPSR
jgi:hypothetical protein